MDYPLIWAGLIAVAVMLYVLLDGFDLGVGILTVLLFAGLGTLLIKLLEWIALAFVGLSPPVVATISYIIFPSMVYNVVLLAPAYFVVRLIQRAFGDEV